MEGRHAMNKLMISRGFSTSGVAIICEVLARKIGLNTFLRKYSDEKCPGSTLNWSCAQVQSDLKEMYLANFQTFIR